MTRDEVLERLDRMASFWAASDVREGVKNGPYATALRAAAEIIRDGGWRSLHHGLDRDTGLTCGMWEQLPNGKHRWYVCPQQMCPGFAIQRGYTHYLPEPAPPAQIQSVVAAMRCLTQAERYVIERYFWGDMLLKGIGRGVGKSQNWAWHKLHDELEKFLYTELLG